MSDSYVEGQCVDRYGVPMGVACDVIVVDYSNYEVLTYNTSVSGTGIFSITVSGVSAGSKVLVTYGYPGDYKTFSYLAGAEYMTTTSGATFSGGGS